ncbi:unnamed protein product, partial [Rotaria sp. Silwood1]
MKLHKILAVNYVKRQWYSGNMVVCRTTV